MKKKLGRFLVGESRMYYLNELISLLDKNVILELKMFNNNYK